MRTTVADVLLTEAREIVCRYELSRDAPPPGPRLLRKLVGEPPAKVAWTAALVRQGLGYYAGCVGEGTDWLTPKLSAVLAREVRTLDRREQQLRVRLAGLRVRWRQAAAWRVADVVMPKPGRDDRIIRYESHLHKLLTSTLHELERLRAARAKKDVPVSAAVDVAVDVTGGAG